MVRPFASAEIAHRMRDSQLHAQTIIHWHMQSHGMQHRRT
ncbi:hypothetical protein LHGZ1_3170 [Laribacter hongkongensis]|uniref:Uncharacterized protein n=1 Tax=Laribacter hongkongensis TaxID=168471 RepID=A0A248LNF0_9NEIS|nr:hypothetical protein LHGZ1_3170 [Laribacter hongkongensis]